ncbi:hypothetical protein GCM10022222_33110 [Amycolatopsis ultiminotia]|uniref:Uncharacterized protein n=2 Tax=Amycolatopsis ultiminotia TaxID=543629 RepID=A0ABP6WA83_9PSEU
MRPQTPGSIRPVYQGAMMAEARRNSEPPDTPLFLERAANTFVKAADAGLLDAEELLWLLNHLRSAVPAPRTAR